MRHERPVVNQVSSGPPSHKVGEAQQRFIIKWKWCVCEGPEQALRAQGSPMRKWLRRPRSPRLCSAFSLQPAPMALWGIYFPRIRDRGRQDSGLVYGWLCTICSRTHRRATPGPQPRPGASPEDLVKGKPQGAGLQAAHWLCTWPRRRSGRLCGYTPILGLRPVVWLDSQGLGRTVTGKLVTKKFGKEEYG